MRVLVALGITLLCHTLDVIAYQIFGIVGWVAYGWTLHVTMLWVGYLLLRSDVFLTFLVSLVLAFTVSASGMHDFWEMFLPIGFVIGLSVFMQAWMISQRHWQRLFYVVILFGAWMGVCHIKVAMQTSDVLAYLMQSHLVTSWSLNAVFYVVLLHRVFDRMYGYLSRFGTPAYVE